MYIPYKQQVLRPENEKVSILKEHLLTWLTTLYYVFSSANKKKYEEIRIVIKGTRFIK